MIRSETDGKAGGLRVCLQVRLLLRFSSARACCKNHCTNLYVPICALAMFDLVNVAPLRLPNRTSSEHKLERTSWYKHFFNLLTYVLTKLIVKGLMLKCSQ